MKRLPGMAWLCLVALSLSACGPALYTAKLVSAERQLDRAREQNARWYAPYEYYFAEVHLQKAREEAAEASYEDALRFARTAEEFSSRALEITERRRQSER